VLRRKGETVVEISKSACSGGRDCINKIQSIATSLLQRKLVLQAQCGSSVPGKKCKITLAVSEHFIVETGVATAAKEPRGICGDTFSVVPIGHGKVGLIVSDGMGSGSKAAGESGITVGLLEKLLSAGFHVDLAVRTVNAMLLLKTPAESFVTIDMTVVDTNLDEAEFIKAGAAPSFVKRVREVAIINSATLPAGVLNQIEIEPVRWKLADGDVIVMISDGVVDLPGNERKREPWIVNYLRRMADDMHPQELADKILEAAKDMAGPDLRDDMTVLVAKVSSRAAGENK
jgi:stage II sporulation protein E